MEFHQFLQGFLQKHSEFLNTSKKTTRPLFLFGESYAGRYIPQMITYSLTQDTGITLNYMGAGLGRVWVTLIFSIFNLVLGNAWIHPRIQYDYSDFAHALGFITLGQRNAMKQKFQQCVATLDAHQYFSPLCLGNLNEILSASKRLGGSSLNVYDVRIYDEDSRKYPPGKDIVEKYLNRKDVRVAIHAVHQSLYSECNTHVYSALQQEDGVSTLLDVNVMLTKGVQVLVYNGQVNIIIL